MEFLEFEGKTTEEAIQQACKHFQLPPESLDIEIVSVGSPGLFGIGGRKARVRVITSREEESATDDADLLPQSQELLERILELMGEKAKVAGRFDEEDRLSLSITPDDSLRLLPGLYGTDGFFVAVLEKS